MLCQRQLLVVVLLRKSFESFVVDWGSVGVCVVEKEVLVMNKDMECEVSNQREREAIIYIKRNRFQKLKSEMFSHGRHCHIFFPN